VPAYFSTFHFCVEIFSIFRFFVSGQATSGRWQIQPKSDCFEPKLNPIRTVFSEISPIRYTLAYIDALRKRSFQLSSKIEISCAKCGNFARFQPSSNMAHGVWAHVKRKRAIFPWKLVHRIGVDLYYLSWSEFVLSDRQLGFLWLIILELGLPLTSAGKGKLLTMTGERYNKNELLIKNLVWNV